MSEGLSSPAVAGKKEARAVMVARKTNKKHVSWGAEWTWQEGEEEATRARKRAFKSRKKSRKGQSMQRTEEENREYEHIQARWMLTILQTPACHQDIIRICGQTDNHSADVSIQAVTKCLGYPISDSLPIGQALQDIAGDNNISVDQVEKNEQLRNWLYYSFRNKFIRELFSPYSQPFSGTDSIGTRNRRNVEAAASLESPELLNRIKELQPALQQMVLSFTTRFGGQNYNQSQENRSRFLHRYGLLADPQPPAPAAGAAGPRAGNHHDSDEIGTTHYPPESDPSIHQTSSSEKEDDQQRIRSDRIGTSHTTGGDEDTDGIDESEQPDTDQKKPAAKRRKGNDSG